MNRQTPPRTAAHDQPPSNTGISGANPPRKAYVRPGVRRLDDLGNQTWSKTFAPNETSGASCGPS